MTIGENLREKIRDLELNYLDEPGTVKEEQVREIILDTYALAVFLFEEKMKRGEELLNEEKEVYQLCKQTLDEEHSHPTSLESVWGVLFDAIEQVRDCSDELAIWFDLSSERDKAGMELVKAGSKLLPGYGGHIKRFFSTVIEFFMPVLSPTVIGIAMGQAECAQNYQEKQEIDKQEASDMLYLADCAYGESKETCGYRKLKKENLPASIRILYDEETGLLTSSRGLQVWLGEKDDNTAVAAYCGTDVKDWNMVYADIIQLSSPSTLYLKGAGLLSLLIEELKHTRILVTGHSLGGGLCQFSVAANIERANSAGKTLQGYGYNPAGLSAIATKELKKERMNAAKKVMRIFMTCKDPVSVFGGKLGCLTVLPATESNGHGIADLKKCMEEYLKQSPAPAPIITMKTYLRNHKNQMDFIPYTRKLSVKLPSGAISPFFNTDTESEAEDFASANFSPALLSELGVSEETQTCCLGIYNGLNGTVHTAVNRLLLFAADGPKITTKASGDIQSTIVYGKFGLGIRDFIPIVTEAYKKSETAFAGNRSYFEQALAALNNPLEYDKAAWCEGILRQFQIDISQIFDKYPFAEQSFEEFLVDFSSKRIELYQSIYKKDIPIREKKKTFLDKLKLAAISRLDGLMERAVLSGIMNENDKKEYLKEIEYFADRVINNVPD